MEEPFAAGTLIDGRYEVRRKLGRGGSANAYLAEHVFRHESFVVKVSRTEPRVTAHALKHEAALLGKLNHPRIVKLRDGGTLSDGRQFLVTDWVDGGTLIDAFGKARPSIDNALDVGEALLEALAAAHEAGIVHRDVKPKNVLVHFGPDGPVWQRAVLIDFDVAAEMTDCSPAGVRRVGMGHVSGTPIFMAPEQAMGKPHGPAADVYGAGAVLHYLLLGCAPSSAPITQYVLSAVQMTISVPLDRLSNDCEEVLLADLPESVKAVIESMLRSNPAARPETARAALDALRCARSTVKSDAGTV